MTPRLHRRVVKNLRRDFFTSSVIILVLKYVDVFMVYENYSGLAVILRTDQQHQALLAVTTRSILHHYRP
jgi:hypothetical protein